MQKNIHPGVAVVIILVVLGVAAFALWWPNRPRPIPDHFGPLSPAQGQAGNAPAAAPAPMGAPAKGKESKPTGSK